MRIVVGISALAAAGMMPGAAYAAGPADLFGDAASAAVTQRTVTDMRLAPDVRLRGDLLTTAAHADPFGNPDGAARHRFASQMIDYYPLGTATGLRLSAGLRFFEVQNFYGDAVRATGGLLWEPRVTGRNTGMRTGFGRHTPAATVGYATTIKNAVFGVEVGSLLGTANARVPSAFGMGRFSRSGGLNPIANFNVAVKF